MPVRSVLVEAYVETLAQAERAVAEGADRLELCGPGEGGLTPPDGLLAQVRTRCAVPVRVMIRPRAGDFVYSPSEFQAMRRSIQVAADTGADGVVLGILRVSKALDLERMRDLVAAARPLRVICHRAFDLTPDAGEAFDQLVALGVDGVLTAGHAPTASEGAATIARHVRRADAASRPLEVIAGGSVRGANARALVESTNVCAVHARATEVGTIAAIVAALRS